jgi:hypothetical protein
VLILRRGTAPRAVCVLPATRAALAEALRQVGADESQLAGLQALCEA